MALQDEVDRIKNEINEEPGTLKIKTKLKTKLNPSAPVFIPRVGTATTTATTDLSSDNFSSDIFFRHEGEIDAPIHIHNACHEIRHSESELSETKRQNRNLNLNSNLNSNGDCNAKVSSRLNLNLDAAFSDITHYVDAEGHVSHKYPPGLWNVDESLGVLNTGFENKTVSVFDVSELKEDSITSSNIAPYPSFVFNNIHSDGKYNTGYIVIDTTGGHTHTSDCLTHTTCGGTSTSEEQIPPCDTAGANLWMGLCETIVADDPQLLKLFWPCFSRVVRCLSIIHID